MAYEQYRVQQLDGVSEDTMGRLEMHSGRLNVTEGGSSMFFWDFIKPSSTKQRPLTIWLNGGPGCSSMDGALMEVGPLRVVDSAQVEWNQGWFEMSDLLFIDQPLNTGFSIKSNEDDYDIELTTSTDRLMTFLERYFKLLADSNIEYNEIIIGGESYAGQYIPHLARSFKDSSWGSSKLKAITMGNAWLDPNLQSLSFIPFAIKRGIIDPTKDGEKLSKLLRAQETCQNKMNQLTDIKFVDQSCDGILSKVLTAFKPESNKCINVYDISKVDSYPSCGNNWPETLNAVTQYLNKPMVQTSLNLGDNLVKWHECNNDVFKYFQPSKGNSKLGAELLPGLLDDGVKIQLFSGVNDLICNSMSTEMVIRKYFKEYTQLDERSGSDGSPGIQEFEMDYEWFHEDENAGSAWIRDGLSYVKVNDASHMVAYDVSKRSIGLLELVLNDTITANDGVLLTTGKRFEQNNETGGEGHFTVANDNRRLIAIVSLVFIFIGLCGYLVRSSLNKRKYSSLSKGANGKKKRVHWRDLDELDDEQSIGMEMQTL